MDSDIVRAYLNFTGIVLMEVAVAEYLEVADKIIKRGGPEVSEYEYIKNIPSEMLEIPLEEQLKVYELLSPLLVTDSMLGFTFRKPHGYAGDFELIDRIYRKRESQNKNLYKWDRFYHDLEAAEAVRNRKKYFKDLANNIEARYGSAKVLNLGSGPCFDLYEYLRSKAKHSLSFDCLDMDKTAIEYGEVVCDNYVDHITFINKNALTFNPDYKYELIWSAGLFDYFNDKIFVRLLRRVYALLKSGGELVIGNFSTYNPSRSVMELYGQWYLHHRSEETLIELAIEAGVPRDLIEVSQEDVGVNLFLHLRKG